MEFFSSFAHWAIHPGSKDLQLRHLILSKKDESLKNLQY